MKAPRSLVFSLLFLLFTTFTAAWPWPKWLPELDSLVVRQNDNNDNSQETSATPTRAPQTTGGSSRTTNNAASSITDPPSTESEGESSTTRSGTGSQTGSQRSSSSSRRTSTGTRKTSYDPRLPAGGVAMITPSVMDGEQYFKVGDFITFAWNYTSLEATPTAVNVMATNKAQNELHTIAMNQTISNATQVVVWDTKAYQTGNRDNPLYTEKYTLIIYDADSSISANAQPGYLAVYNQYSFGLYTPQPYVPLADFVCPICSSALGDAQRRAVGVVIGVGVVTVLSFTWFVGGTGVIW